MEEKESPKRERAVKPVILLPGKKWVLKIGFFMVLKEIIHGNCDLI